MWACTTRWAGVLRTAVNSRPSRSELCQNYTGLSRLLSFFSGNCCCCSINTCYLFIVYQSSSAYMPRFTKYATLMGSKQKFYLGWVVLAVQLKRFSALWWPCITRWTVVLHIFINWHQIRIGIAAPSCTQLNQKYHPGLSKLPTFFLSLGTDFENGFHTILTTVSVLMLFRSDCQADLQRFSITQLDFSLQTMQDIPDDCTYIMLLSLAAQRTHRRYVKYKL